MKTPTDRMIAELRAAELVIGVLDQAAAIITGPLERLFSAQYRAALDARDAVLREWNEEASQGVTDARRMLHRCTEAGHPYHLAEDGACGVYTPNYTRVCDACARQRRADRVVGSAAAAD